MSVFQRVNQSAKEPLIAFKVPLLASEPKGNVSGTPVLAWSGISGVTGVGRQFLALRDLSWEPSIVA
ncbi:hypothetical protein GGE07_001250 [Sinorhizobium terangae]|nr:hypothetical protein [Sinorhizobium terangae]